METIQAVLDRELERMTHLVRVNGRKAPLVGNHTQGDVILLDVLTQPFTDPEEGEECTRIDTPTMARQRICPECDSDVKKSGFCIMGNI
jgi:hypothetical protein